MGGLRLAASSLSLVRLRDSIGTYNQLAGTSVERLSGISDGIFSVSMTLLVLGLAGPTLSGPAPTESELWNFLAKLGPNVLVYVIAS